MSSCSSLASGLELEGQPDRAEPNRGLPADRERAAEVEVSFGPHDPGGNVDLERRGDGAQRDSRAGHERLEEHVARAEAEPVAAGRGMQACLDERPARRHRARDPRTECPRGAQRHEGRRRIVAVALLQRLLRLAQLIAVDDSPLGRRFSILRRL